jgi:hypothetical protein
MKAPAMVPCDGSVAPNSVAHQEAVARGWGGEAGAKCRPGGQFARLQRGLGWFCGARPARRSARRSVGRLEDQAPTGAAGRRWERRRPRLQPLPGGAGPSVGAGLRPQSGLRPFLPPPPPAPPAPPAFTALSAGAMPAYPWRAAGGQWTMEASRAGGRAIGSGFADGSRLSEPHASPPLQPLEAELATGTGTPASAVSKETRGAGRASPLCRRHSRHRTPPRPHGQPTPCCGGANCPPGRHLRFPLAVPDP